VGPAPLTRGDGEVAVLSEGVTAGRRGDYDSLLVRCLIGALLVYGLIVPLAAPRDEDVTEPVAP
jgi:hypothetical protein